MPLQQRYRALRRTPDIKRSYNAIHARGSDHVAAVLIPIVRQGFRRREAGSVRADGGGGEPRGGGVDGDGGGEVVGCAGWGAEVEDSEGGVAGDGGEDGGAVRGEGGAIGAGVGGEGDD
jgi:hypothetical protein